jgi:hypothetical protein
LKTLKINRNNEAPAVPKYNIKVVSAQAGIRPVTLRAWESSYHLLAPHRSQSSYRLYSDRYIAVLCRLKSRMDDAIAFTTARAEATESPARTTSR